MPVKGGIKKKKKKKTGTELALIEGTDNQLAQQDGLQQDGEGEGLPTGVKKVTPDGLVLDPEALPDKRTEAEKRHEEHMRKYEEERARKAAKKSHRDRIKEFNDKLAQMTEHHDLFNVSYTA